MKFHSTLVCAAALATALVGCKSMNDSNSVNTSTSSSPSRAISRTSSTGTYSTSNGSAKGGSATKLSNNSSNNNSSASQSGRTAREASAPTSSGPMATASMAYPTGDVDTSAIMIKKVAPAEVLAGNEFEYQIIVQNLTDDALEGVQLTETIPSNLRVSGSSPRASSTAGGKASWNLGTLSEGETQTITVTGTATNTEPVLTCSSVAYSSGVCLSVPVVSPSLELLASGPASAIRCEDIVYTYEVSNNGTGIARDVVIDIPLPAGLVDAQGRNALKKTIGNLAGGKSERFNVKLNAQESTTFKHIATATAAGGLTATAAQIETITTNPIVTIAATGDEKIFSGRDLRYTVKIANPSDSEATDVIVSAALPANSAFKSATMNGRESGGRISWELGTLQANSEETIELRVTPGDMGTFTTKFDAQGYCLGDVSSSVSSLVRGIAAIKLEVIDMEDPILIGDTATYRIKVTNQGTAPGHDIKIACQLPPNVAFIDSEGSATQLMAGAGTAGRVIFQPVLSLAPKATSTFMVRVRGNSAADARFRVSMTSQELETPVDETEATTFYE